MTYTTQNFATKRALVDALGRGEEVSVYEPGVFAQQPNGVVYLEGPHSPKAHSWYATAEVRNGIVQRLLTSTQARQVLADRRTDG